MAELVDALDSGSSEETHTGSSPANRTKMFIYFINKEDYYEISY